MPDLQAQFEHTVATAKDLSQRPDNPTLLKIYALYKQATEGDNDAPKPSFTDLVGRAKYDAWAKFKGTAREEAMQQYIDLVESLKNA